VGFDTYLEVDDDIVLMWRKHASSTPRVLFRFEDLRISSGVDVDDEPVVEVRFTTTAEQALGNLEAAGLGWHAAVVAYADVRLVGGYSSGLLVGSAISKSSPDDGQEVAAERERAVFEALPAEEDLRSLGQLMLSQWLDNTCEDIALVSELTYDGDLPVAREASFGVYRAADERGVTNPFAAARAAESLALLDRIAPMLCWPLILCVFLRHLPADTKIELVLTEDAAITGEVHDTASAVDYATSYWAAASDALASGARTLERLFAVLASSDSGAGAEFWFARAADLLARLRALATDEEVTTRARGDALESLVDALVHTEEPELLVLEKNFRTTEVEIDLVVTNGLKDPFWIALSSPLILVECKNWTERVGVPELRILESKIRDRGALCRIGIFVSLSGFTKTFLDRLKAVQADGGVIFAVDGEDLVRLIAEKRRLTDWLREEGLRRSLGGRP